MPTFDLTDDGEKTRLVLNGKVLEDSSGSRSGSGLSYADLWGEAVQQTESLSISDFSAQFWRIEMHLPNVKKDPESWSFTHAEFSPDKAAPHGSVVITFRTTIDIGFWARPYGIAELETALETVVNANPELGFEPEKDIGDDLGVSCHVSTDTTIREIISMSSRLPSLVRLVEDKFSSRKYSNSVVERFEFPAPIRSACEQYLLYFAQFLRDLGIEADSELKEEASKVLFAVTPRKEEQALGTIRDALALYLQIPSATDFSMMASGFNDIAISQLQANVLHLQSQIVLARAVLEAKEATIAARDAQISALQQRLDLRQFVPAEVSEAKKDSDSEPIIDGVLAIKKYDFKFLQIDFPEILRKLKRRW